MGENAASASIASISAALCCEIMFEASTRYRFDAGSTAVVACTGSAETVGFLRILFWLVINVSSCNR